MEVFKPVDKIIPTKNWWARTRGNSTKPDKPVTFYMNSRSDGGRVGESYFTVTVFSILRL